MVKLLAFPGFQMALKTKEPAGKEKALPDWERQPREKAQ
jgi:hypothetical protein